MPPELLPERTPGVLAVLYLVFNEGTPATSVRWSGSSLCDEAIRLARDRRALMPDEPEAAGLLALMLLQHSRRETRVAASGVLVLLEDQDRARWDHDMIDEGLATLDRVLELRRPGSYQIQAAIAALHARAPRPEDTDWPQIAALYERLAERLLTGDRTEPCCGRRDGRRPASAASRSSRRRPPSSTTTTCSIRPEPSCSDGWGVTTRPSPTAGRSSSTNESVRAFLEHRIAELTG